MRLTLIKTSFRIFMALMLVAPLITTTSCTSKKKLAEQARLEAEKQKQALIVDAKSRLQKLLDSPQASTMDELRKKEQELEAIKNMNIDEADIREMIAQAEEKLRRERQYLENLNKPKEKVETAPKPMGISASELMNHFSGIASASSAEIANAKIEDALRNFVGDNTPVLVIISKTAGVKDYDKPTTIRKYLNYLKDVRKNNNAVENISYDANGKISELELIKSN